MVHIRSALSTAGYQVFHRSVLRKNAKKRNSEVDGTSSAVGKSPAGVQMGLGLSRHCRHARMAQHACDLCHWLYWRGNIVLLLLDQCMSVFMHVCIEVSTRDCVIALLRPMSRVWFEMIKLQVANIELLR